MAVELRTGAYGSYYGNPQGSSNTLTQAQMQLNATYIKNSLTAKGWTLNAIAGILGNMQSESAINPGRWQGDNVGVGPAYGLTQWDPYTKYTNWATSEGYDYSTMDSNIARIIYELQNGLQYYATSGYPESFTEFSRSTQTPYYLACAFAWNYERSAVVLWGTEAEKEALRQQRGGNANNWYSYLSGDTPPTPPPGPGPGPAIIPARKKGYNFILFNRRRRMKNG